jgi:oxygen-independent coproporphyrinogen-3 oxidase
MIQGVYVHVPFCVRKCHYCGFYSVPFSSALAEQYVDMVLKEASLYADRKKPALQTLYIGGGTPTVMPPALLNRFLTGLRQQLDLRHVREFTVEANPGTVTRQTLEILREHGVNRVSLGVQSFRGPMLKQLGRIHSGKTAQAAFNSLRKAGFTNRGIDLIFAVPGQTLSAWRHDLERGLALKPEHISLYGLSLEPGTTFAALVKSKKMKIFDDGLYADMYQLAHAMLADQGYRHYEISNFALPGYESAHNSAYWDHAAYLGLGPAAHSFDGHVRWWNVSSVDTYIRRLAAGRLPVAKQERLSLATLGREAVFLSLRKAEGLNLRMFKKKFCFDFYRRHQKAITRYIDKGLVRMAQGHVRMTVAGWLMADSVMAELM